MVEPDLLAVVGLLAKPALARRVISARAPRRALACARGTRLARELAPERDHVHVQFPLDASSAALVASELSGCSFSFSGHTLHRLDLMREKLARADFVVVGSEFEREVLCRRYGDEWRDRIQVRRLGVPPREARSSRAAGLVVSIGTLAGKKGHDVLIRAVGELVRSGREVRLEVVGEGPDRDLLLALAAAEGVSGRVALLGARPYEDALERAARAAAFALCCRETPDGDHDCLPVALMDAMSLAVPTVSTAALGIPELIEHEVSGLLAAPGDHVGVAELLGRLLDDMDRAERIGLGGQAAVRRDYDLERNAGRLAELFRERLAPATPA